LRRRAARERRDDQREAEADGGGAKARGPTILASPRTRLKKLKRLRGHVTLHAAIAFEVVLGLVGLLAYRPLPLLPTA
jgi:hypothetical protein